MQHHVIARRNLSKPPQRACEQTRQVSPVFSWMGRLKLMIMRSRQNPHFVRHARGVRTESVVLANTVHDARLLSDFLANNIAENAALVIFIPKSRRAQFVEDAPWDERRSRHLRV